MVETRISDETKNQIRKWKESDDELIFLIENLVSKNTIEALNQEDFRKRYKSYDDEHQEIIKKTEELENEISNRPFVLEKWNDDVWSYLIDRSTVNRVVS